MTNLGLGRRDGNANQREFSIIQLQVNALQEISPIRAPAISVCIPNYNYADYLAECIASVLAQDFTDFELLIQDDGSTDDWETVVRQFHDPRISVGRNPTRLGFVGNWNACIARARGEWVALLHADDYFLPGMLRAAHQVFQVRDTVGLVFSAVQLIDGDGAHKRVWQPFADDFVSNSAEFLPELVRGNFIRTPTVMVRRRAYAELGAFSRKLAFTADWEMWLRIAAAYEVAYLATPYAAYREHARNATRAFERNVKDMQADRDALDLFFQEHPQYTSLVPPAYTAASERAMEQLQGCLADGDAAHAVEYAQLAAEMQATAQGQNAAAEGAALEILAACAVELVRSHRELEQWALELQAEIERRDSAPGWGRGKSPVSRVVQALQRTERKTDE